MNLDKCLPPKSETREDPMEPVERENSHLEAELESLKNSVTGLRSEFYGMLGILWLYMLLACSRLLKGSDSWADALLSIGMFGMTVYFSYRSVQLRRARTESASAMVQRKRWIS